MWASFVSVLSGLFKLSNQLVAWARQRQMVSLGEDRANKAHAEKSLDNIKKAIRSRADIQVAQHNRVWRSLCAKRKRLKEDRSPPRNVSPTAPKSKTRPPRKGTPRNLDFSIST